MEVILLESVKKLGKPGDLVKVKPGFGRNFLIPQKKAVRATADNKSFYESKKSELLLKDSEERSRAEAILTEISGKTYSFSRQAGDDGRLFGSVSAKDIADAVSEIAKISSSQVSLEKAIKTLGSVDVEINLYADIIATVTVSVSRHD
jgi:large subunit ribosomal protein L9